MRVRQVDDATAFLELARPLLLADEARHNLLLGLAGTLVESPDLYPERHLWLVEDGGDVVGAALRTLPHNLVLAQPRHPGVVEGLVDAIALDGLPGVTAAVPEVDAFVSAWSLRTGRDPGRRRLQGIFALERVEPLERTSGSLRLATPGDEALARAWWRQFAIEALDLEDPDDDVIARAVRYRIGGTDAGIALWESGGSIVSFAGFGGATPNGIRIGPVYTPSELRGRGYATALVARLSQQLLDGGRRFCFLYTDLANPTANRIYDRIGYRRVCESAEVTFEPAAR